MLPIVSLDVLKRKNANLFLLKQKLVLVKSQKGIETYVYSFDI